MPGQLAITIKWYTDMTNSIIDVLPRIGRYKKEIIEKKCKKYQSMLNVFENKANDFDAWGIRKNAPVFTVVLRERIKIARGLLNKAIDEYKLELK